MTDCFSFLLMTIFLLCMVSPARAVETNNSEARLKNRQIIEELNRALESRDAVIFELVRRVEALEKELHNKSAAEVSAAVPPLDVPVPVRTAEIKEGEELDETDKLAESALERSLIEQGSLLLPAGALEIQPSFGYRLATTNSLNIDCLMIEDILCIGDIGSEHLRRESYLLDWTFRLGLPWNMQLDLNVPYSYSVRTIDFADGSAESEDVSGLGDMSLSLSRQLLRGKDWFPDLVGLMRWKSTTGSDPYKDNDGLATGSGFHDLQFSLSGIKVSDPVVFFGSLSYSKSLAADKAGIGRVEPGQSLGTQLGLSFALNLETSLSIGWSQSWVENTRVDGATIGGSFERPGSLRLGATYIPTAGRSIDFGLNIGVTDDAPDVEISLAFPWRLPKRISF